MNRAIHLSVYLTAPFLSCVIVLLVNTVLAETPRTVYIGFPIPECSRIFFGLYGAGHFEYYMPGNRQNIQQIQFNNYYAQKIAPALRKIDNLPEQVKQAAQKLRKTLPSEGKGGILGALFGGGRVPRQDNLEVPDAEFYTNLSKLFERTILASAKDDRSEPSLSMLASLLQDESLYFFLLILNQGSNANTANTETVALKTVFASHPLVNHLGLACQDQAVKEEYKKKFYDTKIPYEMLSQVRAGLENLSESNIWHEGKYISPYYFSCRFADKENVRDMIANNREVRRSVSRSIPVYTVDVLEKLCPKNPLAVAERLIRNWTYSDTEAETVLKEFAEYPNVCEAITYQYQKNNRIDKAFAVMRNKLKSKPDDTLALHIADLYLKQGDCVNAVDILKEYLNLPGATDPMGYIALKLGQILFAEGKITEAEPYLNQAVKMYSYDGLSVLFRYQEAVGKSDKAEKNYASLMESMRASVFDGAQDILNPRFFQWWATCYRTDHARLAELTEKIFESFLQMKEKNQKIYGAEQLYYLACCMGIPIQEEFSNDPAVRVFFLHEQPAAGFLAFLDALENKDEVKAAAMLNLLQERGSLIGKADFGYSVGKVRLPSGQEMLRVRKPALRLLAALFALDRRSQNPGSLNKDAVETLLRISYDNILENEDALFILYFLGRYYTICGKKEKGLECYRRVLAAKNLTAVFPSCFAIKELRDAGISEKDILQMIQTDAELPRKPIDKAESDKFSMRLLEALENTETANNETVFEVRRCELPVTDIFPEGAAPWSIPNTELVHQIKRRSYRSAWSPDGNVLRTLKHHKANLYGATFFSNGTRLITVSKDKTAFIYNVQTWEPILNLQGHREEIRVVAASPDERIIATGSYDNTVILWDAQTGEPLRRLGMFNGDVVGLAFSPDGSKLAVSKNYNGEHTYILDTKTWKTILYAPGHGWWNGKPSWSPNGRFIVTRGNDTRIEKIPSDDETVPNDKFAGKTDILLKDFGVAGVSSGAEPPKFNTFSSSRKKFTDSLWGHASSRFVVTLNGHWQTFKTSFGISTSANLDEASCFFAVIGDGNELFRSELIRDSLDRPLELDVRNIKRLELIVDPNGNNHNDHGVWLTPKLLR